MRDITQANLQKYLKRENLSLAVPTGLRKAAFDDARQEAFLVAVNVWNELKPRNERKIRLPAKPYNDAIDFPQQLGVFAGPPLSTQTPEGEGESEDDE